MSQADPRRQIGTRKICYEPIFDVESFKGKPYCDRALEIIRKSDLKAFTKLPKEAYPEVVRKFYTRFKCNEETGKINVQIDEIEVSFSCFDISKALGLKYKPVAQTLPEKMMKLELMKKPNSRAKEIRTSSLHEDYWLVDKFIREFTCPFLKNNTSIPKYAYQFWHSLFVRGVIDVPLLVMEMMKVSHHGGKKNNIHGLVLPRTITAILKHKGFHFERRDRKVEVTDKWSYEKAKKGLRQLAGSLKGKASASDAQDEDEEDDEEDDEDEEMEDNQGYDHGNTSNAQGDWDHIVEQQEPPQSNWGNNAWTQGSSQGTWGTHAHYQGPPQSYWDAQARGQEQLCNMMQRIDVKMDGYGSRLEDIQQTMSGYGSTLDGIQGSMDNYGVRLDGIQSELQGYGSSLRSLETRVQGLEDRRWGGEQYQKRRKSTMTFEYEQSEHPSGCK